jgi:hypothetical protein
MEAPDMQNFAISRFARTMVGDERQTTNGE